MSLLAAPILTLLATPVALAQSAAVDRPLLPAYSMAGEDGAATLWQNPANLAFDRDAGYAVLFSQNLDVDQPASFAVAGSTGPLATGLHYTTGLDGSAWWTLSSGLGLQLDRNLALGVHLGWQLPSGPDNNLLSWDISAAWRPLTWFGLSAAVQNVGNPDEESGLEQRYVVGTVLRPWNGRAMLGLDYVKAISDASALDGRLGGTLRLIPTRGLAVRLNADSDRTFGAGLEVNVGGPRVGVHALASGAGGLPIGMGYLLSGPEDERLFGGRDTVAQFVLEDDFPYVPPNGIFLADAESYLHLLERLRQASEDRNLRGVLLHLDATPFSLAQIMELRHAIEELRASGRPVVAYLDRASSNAAYLLACAADKVYLHPAAQIDLVGLSAEMQFFKGTLDLVGVKPQYARRAEYKSAVESYMNTESTPASREQMDALLDDLSEVLVDGIAASRGRKPEDVRTILDRGPFTATEAFNEGLIDGMLYPDELSGSLSEVFQEDYELDEEYGLATDESGWRSPYEIAVVYIEGAIISGPSTAPGLLGGVGQTGSDTVIAQLEQARRESSVKAVVLRVDSPGGSAFASDEIWREVERVKREKPVVVSMGSVAASGGYYVSAGATRIFAEPATITGSIGVFGGKFSLEGLYEKVGVEYEMYNRGRNAGMYSLSKPFDPEEFAALDRMIGDTYAQFKSRVVAGRHMDPDKVEQVARGRVWSGKDALEQGLVDELGGFQDAIEAARDLADLPERSKVDLVTYRGPAGSESFARSSVRAFADALPAALLQRHPVRVPPELSLLQQYSFMSNETIWAILPYQIQVR